MVVEVRGSQWLRDKDPATASLSLPPLDRQTSHSEAPLGNGMLWFPNAPQEASLQWQRNTGTPRRPLGMGLKCCPSLGCDPRPQELWRPLQWLCGAGLGSAIPTAEAAPVEGSCLQN